MNEFEALIHSLGEHTVITLGRDNIRRIDVFGDPTDTTAHIEIVLRDQSWESMAAAVEKMIEVREMFFAEISIDYRFASEDSETPASAAARRSDYSVLV